MFLPKLFTVVLDDGGHVLNMTFRKDTRLRKIELREDTKK